MFTRFAVLGAYDVSPSSSRSFGPVLVDAVSSAPGTQVTVLTRHPVGTLVDPYTRANVTVDSYGSSSDGTFSKGLVDILISKKVEVLVSTVGFGGISSQQAIADAAKAAGVQLFVPSEWSLPTDGPLDLTDPLSPKKQVHQHLDSIGLPFTLFFNGPFADNLYENSNWTYIHDGKTEVVGKGESPISFCTRQDIARFAAHVLTNLPLDKLINRHFHVSAFTATWLDVVRAHEQDRGVKLQINYISYEECAQRVQAGDKHLTRGRAMWDQGGAVLGSTADKEKTASVWPDWRPAQLADLARASRM